jgi:hypothetical protein
MQLFFFRGGSFEHYDLPTRSRCCPRAIEAAIRGMADKRGRISTVSVRIGNEYVPIENMREARVVSRMIAADHDCFTSHLYDKGFVDESKAGPAQQALPDPYADNEIFKLEFEYEQNADLGTPSFGGSKAHADVF